MNSKRSLSVFSISGVCLAAGMVAHAAGSAGNLDLTFDPGVGPDAAVHSVGIDSVGRVIIGGDFNTVASAGRAKLARLTAQGGVDLSFVSFLNASPSEYYVEKLIVQPDDKIAVCGLFYTTWYKDYTRFTYGIGRANPGGDYDVTFDTLGGDPSYSIYAMSLRNGNLLIGGAFTTFGVASGLGRVTEVNSLGTIAGGIWAMAGISGGAAPAAYATEFQGDGKWLVGGAFTSASTLARTNLARLTASGTVDPLFNATCSPNGIVRAIAQQPDGKILVAGEFTMICGAGRNRIARLLANGALDVSFDPGAGPNNTIRCLGLQPDGSVVIGGEFTQVGSASRNRIARLNPDGSLDASWDPGTGADGTVRCLAIQADAKVLIGGDFTHVNGTSRNHIARLNGGLPRLAISMAGSLVTISWSTNAAGAQLQTRPRLDSGAWADVTVPPIVVGGQYLVTVTNTGANAFFRLGSGQSSGLPRLSISMAGSLATVCWSADAVGAQLQSRSDLNSGAWTDVAVSPILNGGQYCVTVTNTGANAFFRLTK